MFLITYFERSLNFLTQTPPTIQPKQNKNLRNVPKTQRRPFRDSNQQPVLRSQQFGRWGRYLTDAYVTGRSLSLFFLLDRIHKNSKRREDSSPYFNNQLSSNSTNTDKTGPQFDHLLPLGLRRQTAAASLARGTWHFRLSEPPFCFFFILDSTPRQRSSGRFQRALHTNQLTQQTVFAFLMT